MKFNLFKKVSDIKLKTLSEREMYRYLDSFELKTFKRGENLNLKADDIQLGFFKSRNEIKNALKEGFMVCIDCFKRSFIYFSREEAVLYLLRIDFDLNEIFGRDVAELMDIREEKILGKNIELQEADILIDNYLKWIEEEREIEEARVLEKDETDDGVSKKNEERELYIWLNKKD